MESTFHIIRWSSHKAQRLALSSLQKELRTWPLLIVLRLVGLLQGCIYRFFKTEVDVNVVVDSKDYHIRLTTKRKIVTCPICGDID